VTATVTVTVTVTVTEIKTDIVTDIVTEIVIVIVTEIAIGVESSQLLFSTLRWIIPINGYKIIQVFEPRLLVAELSEF